MFIGEMGSWLVIAGFWLYRYFIFSSREAPLLYRPVNTEDTEENEDADNDTVRPTSRSASSPALKPLLPSTLR